MFFASKKAYIRKRAAEDDPYAPPRSYAPQAELSTRANKESAPQPANLAAYPQSMEALFSSNDQIQDVEVDLESRLRALIPESEESCVPPPRIRRQRSFESISDNSLNRSLHSMSNSSDEDEEADEVMNLDERKAAPQAERIRHVHDVDTNVVSIQLDCLAQASQIATGEAVFCEYCQAVMNIYSQLTNVNEDQQVWKCEFCKQENPVCLDPEEFPKASVLDYMLQGALDAQGGSAGEERDITIVFCIDISGSMCVTQPAQQGVQLKVRQNIDLGGFSDYNMYEQYLDDQGVQYVSRLQCVQAAIESQIEEMAKVLPNRKIAIITFSSEVSILGDGTSQVITLAGDKLNNFDECVNAGKRAAALQPISQVSKTLIDKLYSLQESGPTALGPALLSAIGVATNGRPGSKVIICTDGLANIGLGDLSELRTDGDRQAAESFYERVGEFAVDNELQVSVITIQGEEAGISHLSLLADRTGGDVERVDPLNLANDFANVLANQVIATQVTAYIQIERGLQFRNEDSDLIDATNLKKNLGNVTSDTEFTFEYGLMPSDQLEEMGIDPTSQQKLHFQTRIYYTKPDGMKCIRVITAQQEVSQDLDEVFEDANFRIMGINAAQQSAKMAQKGDHRKGQSYMRAWRNKLHKNARNQEQQEVVGMYIDKASHVNRGMNAVHWDIADGSKQALYSDEYNLVKRKAAKASKKECAIF